MRSGTNAKAPISKKYEFFLDQDKPVHVSALSPNHYHEVLSSSDEDNGNLQNMEVSVASGIGRRSYDYSQPQDTKIAKKKQPLDPFAKPQRGREAKTEPVHKIF